MKICIRGSSYPQCFLVLRNKRIQQKLIREIGHNQLILGLGSLHEGNAKGFVVSNNGYALFTPPLHFQGLAPNYMLLR
jgi:hypothetical protein